MGVCVGVNSEGWIYKTSETIDACTEFVLVGAEQYRLSVEPALNPADIAYVFAWGFASVVVLGYFGGYAVGIAKSLINKI